MDEETIAEMIAIIVGITLLVVLIVSIAVAWINH
jgi:hypothetical protein